MSFCDKPPVTFWSFSSLSQFEKCPYATYMRRVEKSPLPPRDEDHPLERGNALHAQAEEYVRGESENLPKAKKIAELAADFEELREAYAEGKVQVEQDWGFNDEWHPVDFDYRNPEMWHMSKLDVFYRLSEADARIIDHKSGKSRNNEVKHAQQGQTYAAAAFAKYPELEVVSVEFWYLDEGHISRKNYTRAQAMRLAARLTPRAKVLTECVMFVPKPNRFNCGFCDYGPSKGTGACPFGVDGK